MENVLLDHLPQVWKSDDGKEYKIDTDFRIGVQMCMVQDDPELTDTEKSRTLVELLFIDDAPSDPDEISDCLGWFLSGWSLDKESSKRDNRKIMDFNVDQWRIYAAFLAQYNIDLSKTDMHFWLFMGLLSSLEQCAYTRVIDIRRRKYTAKMDKEEKRQLQEAKEVYDLPQIRTMEEQMEEDEVDDILCGSRSKAEKQRISTFESYAD